MSMSDLDRYFGNYREVLGQVIREGQYPATTVDLMRIRTREAQLVYPSGLPMALSSGTDSYKLWHYWFFTGDNMLKLGRNVKLISSSRKLHESIVTEGLGINLEEMYQWVDGVEMQFDDFVNRIDRLNGKLTELRGRLSYTPSRSWVEGSYTNEQDVIIDEELLRPLFSMAGNGQNPSREYVKSVFKLRGEKGFIPYEFVHMRERNDGVYVMTLTGLDDSAGIWILNANSGSKSNIFPL